MKQIVKFKRSAMAAALASFSSFALASDVSDAFDSLLVAVNEMIGLAWGLVVVVVVAMASIGLFKKFVSRAT